LLRSIEADLPCDPSKFLTGDIAPGVEHWG
jgi:hypothetical protein